MHRIAGGSRSPGRNGTGFRNSLFQNLAIFCFAIIENRANILRFVQLSLRRVNTNLTKQIGHAKGTCLIGHNRHHMAAQYRILEQAAQDPYQCHGARHFASFGLQCKARMGFQWRYRELRMGRRAPWHVTTQCGTSRQQVAHLGTVGGGLVERQIATLLVAQRQLEAIAERKQGIFIELFLLMGGHLAFTRSAHAITLFGLRQDHGRLSLMAGSRMVSRVDLLHVVTTASQPIDFFIGEAGSDLASGGILSEEMFTVECAIVSGKGLQLAIDGAVQGIDQITIGITCKQAIPV